MQLIMLIGPSGSGKSTLAEDLLCRDPDLVVLSSDRIIEDIAAREGLNYQDAYAKYKDDAARQVNREALKAFSEEKNVVWDQTNLERDARRNRLDMVPDSYDKTAVAFEGDYDVLLNRIQNRRDATGKEIPGFVLRAQMHVYDRPDYDEGFDRIIIEALPAAEPETEMSPDI